jgi:hypothetical protein
MDSLSEPFSAITLPPQPGAATSLTSGHVLCLCVLAPAPLTHGFAMVEDLTDTKHFAKWNFPRLSPVKLFHPYASPVGFQ